MLNRNWTFILVTILPIEERFTAITAKPFDVIKLKIVTIAMSRVNLFKLVT